MFRMNSAAGNPFRLAILAPMMAIAGLIGSTPAIAQPPSGVVYVQSNVAASPGNQILGFKRDNAGNLTALPGSPYSAGGAGLAPAFGVGAYDNDTNLITNLSNTLIYATNGGSNSIAAFSFKKDGSLVPIVGSPFPSGGSTPVSLAISGDKMVVVNGDNDPGQPGLFLPSYSTLQIGSDGSLKPISGSAFTIDLGSNPTQAFVPYDNINRVFGCDFLGGILRSFTLQNNGSLVEVDSQALPAAEFADTGDAPLPLGLWSSPNARYLYVGFVTLNRMGVYSYSKAGKLTYLRSVPNSGKGICWIRSNNEGTRLYTSNTAEPSISVYDTSIDPSEPIEIQKVVLNPGAGTSAVFHITLDPTEGWIYAVSQQSASTLPASANALHVLKIADDGTLLEVPTSPKILNVPAMTRPQGVLAF